MATLEANYNTQNSGVVVKSDEKESNMDWYGVLQKVIALDFPGENRSYCLSVIGLMFLTDRRVTRVKVKGAVEMNMGL
jgi:hypothetical protein